MIRTITTLSVCIILLICVKNTLAQIPKQPKKLKVKGIYTHSTTGTLFDEKIGDYIRASVYSFDKKADNIGVSYERRNNSEITTLSVYLYPTVGSEEQLRYEYVSSLKSIANAGSKTGINIQQYPATYKNGDYKINGYTAYINNKSLLTVFECGHWFFKIRISTNNLDSLHVKKLEKEVLDIFKPTELVRKSPIKWEATIHFAPGAFRDSVMLGSVMGSAFKKMEWAKNNIDSLERAAGFPDLYLNLHVAALNEFTQFERRQNFTKINPNTQQYLLELNQIIEAGFLEEFIMEEYDMIMIVPEDVILDFSAYNKWKIFHPTIVDLHQKYSVISFNEK